MPAAANVVVVVATPDALTATGDPMVDPPDSNCTDPAGLVESAATSLAVSVTVCPVVAGFGDADSVVVVDVAAGGDELVLYVLPFAEIVRYVDISGDELPVSDAPEKQYTTSSSVPPLASDATDWIVEIGSSSVPLNAEDTLAIVAEMLNVAPPPSSIRNTAEP